jgi:hypothetical protein
VSGGNSGKSRRIPGLNLEFADVALITQIDVVVGYEGSNIQIF